MSLAQALGHNEGDRLLIVNADDFGSCHSANVGIQQLLAEGAVSSATLMMPCAWAREAALWSAGHPEYNVGIHFTLTSEWDAYKWGPVNRRGDNSTLVTNEGYFPSDCYTFEQQASDEQVRAELIAQVEMALQLGMKPSHADNHMGSLYGLTTGRNFLPVVFDVCAAYGLPFRLPRYVTEDEGQIAPPEMAGLAQQLAALAAMKGVVILDYLLGLPFPSFEGETYDGFKADMIGLLKRLRPGVSEIIIHPSTVTDELRAFHYYPEKRGMELNIFRDPEVVQTIADEGIRLIRWSELQALQRRLAAQTNE